MREKSSKNSKSEKIAKFVAEDLKIPTKNIANAIKTRRTKLKLSMASLAKSSGVAASTLNDIEKAKYLPHIEVILKLAYALDYTYHNIIDLLADKPIKHKKVDIVENSFKLIKLHLDTLDYSELEISEIIEYIKFKGRHKKSLIDFAK